MCELTCPRALGLALSSLLLILAGCDLPGDGDDAARKRDEAVVELQRLVDQVDMPALEAGGAGADEELADGQEVGAYLAGDAHGALAGGRGDDTGVGRDHPELVRSAAEVVVATVSATLADSEASVDGVALSRAFAVLATDPATVALTYRRVNEVMVDHVARAVTAGDDASLKAAGRQWSMVIGAQSVGMPDEDDRFKREPRGQYLAYQYCAALLEVGRLLPGAAATYVEAGGLPPLTSMDEDALAEIFGSVGVFGIDHAYLMLEYDFNPEVSAAEIDAHD